MSFGSTSGCVWSGVTLEEDWPYFDDADPINSYDPLYVDAVVSNPPYSQAWDPTNKEGDARYARFGLAPKGKAVSAFGSAFFPVSSIDSSTRSNRYF